MKLVVIGCVLLIVLAIWNYVLLEDKKIEILGSVPEEITYVAVDSTIDRMKSDLIYWNHMPLTYNYSSKCSSQRVGRIDIALKEIEKFTDYETYFVYVNEKADISFVCSDDKVIAEDGKEILGESEMKYNPDNNKIIVAKIYLYGDVKNGCSYPDVEIHEILHVFGEKHNDYHGSIMNVIQPRCLEEINRSVDRVIFEKLKSVY